MSLDFSKPYAEVHGLPGAVFEQNGIYYRSDGEEATSLTPFVEEVYIPDDTIPPPVACIEQPTSPATADTGRSIEDMHWKHLKTLVESYGGEWTDKKAAVEFMKGK